MNLVKRMMSDIMNKIKLVTFVVSMEASFILNRKIYCTSILSNLE